MNESNIFSWVLGYILFAHADGLKSNVCISMNPTLFHSISLWFFLLVLPGGPVTYLRGRISMQFSPTHHADLQAHLKFHQVEYFGLQTMRDTAVCWVDPSNRFLIFYSCSRVYAKTPCIARQGIMLLSGVSPLSTPCVFVYMYLHLYFCRHIQLYLYLCICICSWVCTSLHVYSLCIMALYKTSPPMSTPAAANMGTAAGFNTSFVYLLFLYLLFLYLLFLYFLICISIYTSGC